MEKTVYLNPDGTLFEGRVNVQGNVANQTPSRTANKSDTEYRSSSQSAMNKKVQPNSALESQLSTFVEQQQQLLKVHEQYIKSVALSLTDLRPERFCKQHHETRSSQPIRGE